MHKPISTSLAIVIASLLLTGQAIAEKKPSTAAGGKPFVVVNGAPISQSFADAVIKDQVNRGAPNDDNLKKMVKEELVRREVVTQLAQKQQLDKDPDVQARLTFLRQDVLLAAYLEDFARKHPVSEAEAKQAYDNDVKAVANEKEYKARHILVKTEEEAQSLIKKIQSGSKLSDLAKQSSIDTGSKDNGGDLNWSRASAFVPEFGTALTKLEKGKFTPQPVKTQFGYHIIELEDVRKFDPPKFEKVKDQITQRLMQIKVQKHVQDMVAQAKVE